MTILPIAMFNDHTAFRDVVVDVGCMSVFYKKYLHSHDRRRFFVWAFVVTVLRYVPPVEYASFSYPLRSVHREYGGLYLSNEKYTK